MPTTEVTITGALSLPPPPPSTGVPITQIAFPHSPSLVPSLSSIMQGAGVAAPPPSAAMHTPPPLPHLPPEPEGPAVPCYHKLSFPTYDGKEDPLGWLLKCEQFFRGQQTRHVDWV